MKRNKIAIKIVLICLMSAVVGGLGIIFSEFFNGALEFSTSYQRLRLFCENNICSLPHEKFYSAMISMLLFHAIITFYSMYLVVFSKNKQIKFSDISESSFNPLGKIKSITTFMGLIIISSSSIFFIDFNTNGYGIKYSIYNISYFFTFSISYLFSIVLTTSIALFFRYRPIVSNKEGQ